MSEDDGGTFIEALDAAVAALQFEIEWEYITALWYEFWGVFVGPHLPPRDFMGLQGMFDEC